MDSIEEGDTRDLGTGFDGGALYAVRGSRAECAPLIARGFILWPALLAIAD